MNENDALPQLEITAGEMLRNARTTGRRKREIPTIAKQLCIREEFLQALEDGNYNVIPEPVYILGFARNYAMELGLDPDEIVAKLKCEMGLSGECQTHSDKDDVADDGVACACAGRGQTLRAWFQHLWEFVRVHWKWFAAGISALVLFIILMSLLLSGGQSVADAAATPDDVAATEQAPVEPKFTVAVRERFGADNRAKGTVVLQAIDESWVKVEDARGNTVFSRVLVPGDVYYVSAAQNQKATFGNAGGIDIWVGGKLAPRAGADHTRKSGISLNPDKLRASAN